MAWMRGWLVMGLIVLVLEIPLGWAESSSSEPAGPDRIDHFAGHHRLHPAFDKLGRGVANALFGWLEVPATASLRYEERDTAGSLLAGAAYGAVRGVVRTAVGVYEAATFFLPYPEDFAPILPTLAYFQKGETRRPLPIE
jgi:putative exosortase-associated protein (TIGR04073 family)